ncbi:unnamed protein product [Cuscuta epithymum]|uniref:PB1 domain-containing protein n=1 Tax=Cuscuta epithymum TaxID=186058 RepID=A0AAV0DUX9_9ASTE|nr:unnamed protein product [Cuscuta epithymum]
MKLLYSYGGRIVPRGGDGRLRYVGGFTRVLCVDRSISYAELMVKLCDACGEAVKLSCKLPSEDLDVLVSICGDEELAVVMEEYEKVSMEMKIRAVLSPSKKTTTTGWPPSSPLSCFDFPPRFNQQQQKQQQQQRVKTYGPGTLIGRSRYLVAAPIRSLRN